MDSWLKQRAQQCRAWIGSDKNRRKVQEMRQDLGRAFTRHPQEAGETYLTHLLFTLTMALRFIYTGIAIMIHGVFPFLMTRTASNQVEMIYQIMKKRSASSNQDGADATCCDYSV